MTTNEIVEVFSSDELNEYEQLVCRLTKIDPELILNHDEVWTDDVKCPEKSTTSLDFRDKLYNEYWNFEAYREQAVLISERKRYELINKLARAMLCKMPLDPEEPYYTVDFLSETEHDYALKLITSMHNTWLDGTDVSFTIPQALSPDKKQILESYRQTIQALDMEDESEGTMANLLYDYCISMIDYDAALQFTYNVETEDLEEGYGEYAMQASYLYNDTIETKLGTHYPIVPTYTI